MAIRTKGDRADLFEDSIATGNLLENDTEAVGVKWIKFDNHSERVNGSVTIEGLYGSLTIYANGDYSYVANSQAAQALAAGDFATERFTYTAEDVNGKTSSAWLTISITGVNDDPVITLGAGDSASANISETDTALTAADTVTVTDVDTSDTVSSSVTGAALTGTTGGLTEADVLSMLTLSPASGLAANTGDTNNLTWSFNSGSASFDFLAVGESLTITYTIASSDGQGGSDTQDISIVIAGTNDGPVTTSDAYSAKSAEPLSISAADGVLANDYDVDSNTLHAVLVSGPAHGVLNLLDDGSFDYTADNGYAGPDSFTYQAFDGFTYSDVTTVTLDVTGGNAVPVAVNDDYSLDADSSLSVNAANGVLSNDSDPDSGDVLEAVILTGPANGTLSLEADGSFTYIPDAGFTGTDSFTYSVFDSTAYSNAATVNLAVDIPNATPVAVDDTYAMNAGLVLTINASDGVLSNDSDTDLDVLTALVLTGPTGGSLSLNADGSFTYTPTAGFTGTDSFTYRAFDGKTYSDPATVSLNVNPIPTPTTVDFQDGLNGYASTIDTTLKQAYPSFSYGNNQNLFVDKADPGSTNERQVLLGFDDLFGSGPGQIPVGATITSATLILETNNASGSSLNGSLYRMLVDWSESSSWDSMVDGVQTNGVEASSVAELTVGATSIGTTAVDVTSSLQAWATAGSTATELNAANQGWLFTTGSTDAWGFDSSEGTVQPKLSVTYVVGTSSMPVVTVADAEQTEGPGAEITFRISLDHVAPQDIVINYSILDGTATAANDLLGPTSGTITILEGQSFYDLAIGLKDDAFTENAETFTLKLTSGSGALIADNSATGLIYDDDPNPVIQPTVVAVTDLTSSVFSSVDDTGYGCSDPSGLAYDPVSQKLFIADSEHEERPFFSLTNLFSIGPGGVVEGYSQESFTLENTGLGINPFNGYMYVSDDDQQGVFWVDPADPTVALGFFDTAALGMDDTEDMRFDPLTGNMFILDGHQKLMYELTVDGAVVGTMNLPSVMKDAEALAYDPTHGVFFIASGASPNIWEMDRDGNILATIDILGAPEYVNPTTGVKVAPKGLELAPSSDANDGAQLSLYVADYGVDQVNDGRLFEIHLGSDWLLA